MLSFVDSLAAKISNLIIIGASARMTDLEFIEHEIDRWKNSPERRMQIKGFMYYRNEHDILFRRRTMIGRDGQLEKVDNLPNNRVIDNQYAKIVNQKANYLLGQPVTFEGQNETYIAQLKLIFDSTFMRTLKNAGKAMLNGGIAWFYPFYDNEGTLRFKLFPAYEVLPFWTDREHTQLDCAIRLYAVIAYEGTIPTVVEKVEIYDLNGVHRYVRDRGKLIPDVTIDNMRANVSHVVYTNKDGAGNLNWGRVPLIALKYNESEIPLLKKVKSLQDGINIMMSDFQNHMEEDARNTILVLKNYDGTDLGEFRRNLATYGAVKVRYDGETKGGVETLEIVVNSENYKVILELMKKALIENAMGYDAKDDRLSGNPNQMNIQSMYSDIDLDANDMETELQAAFDEMLWYVKAHLVNTGVGNFNGEDATIIFNRDILINETEAIENCQKSVGIISDETIISQHPWVDDPAMELKRVEKQKEKELEEQQQQMYDPFASVGGNNGNGSKSTE